MKAQNFVSLAGLAMASLAVVSCVVQPPPGPPPPPPPAPALHVTKTAVAVLPYGAREYNYRGERCWTCKGQYYRHNPNGRGYVMFTPR